MDREGLSLIWQTLRPEERLLWWGKPKGGMKMGIAARIATAIVLVFNVIAWIAFIVTKPEEGELFYTWPAYGFFALIGIGVLWLWRFIGSRQRARRCYAITDRGVIVVHGFGGRQPTRVEFGILEDIQCHAQADGTGSITVYSRIPLLQAPMPRSEARRRTLFRAINDVRHVCMLLQSARREHLASHPPA